MYWTLIKSHIRDFAQDTRGTIMVETVLSLPLLIMGLTAMFEFFEIHRFQSARDKATYTIADMISRENDVITDIYIDNAKILFDEIADDYADNQIRISIIEFDGTNNEYQVNWSEIRGTGGMDVLKDSDVRDDTANLPVLNDGEELILVESEAKYKTIFEIGFDDNMTVETRVFTSIRFAPQMCFDACQSES
ncbi:MAG: pilus assembly protein [Pseudomonadota bacterium]